LHTIAGYDMMKTLIDLLFLESEDL